MGPEWSLAICDTNSDLTESVAAVVAAVNLQIRTVCPRITFPSAMPALTVTTLRTDSDSAGQPATDTVFSCPSNVPKQINCESLLSFVIRDHILAVPSHEPLTNHGLVVVELL